MCGLIFHNGEDWNEIISKNLERAGRNKGSFTFTPVFDDERIAAANALGVMSTYAAQAEIDTDGWEAGVFHMQAPTSDASRPHPANHGRWLVWHNGILKKSIIDMYAEAVGSRWDTKILAFIMDVMGVVGLAGIDGSFACIAFNTETKRLIAFRNRLAPLFTNGTSISSVKISEDWWSMNANRVYILTAEGKWEMTHYTFDDSIVQFEGLK